MYDIEKMLAEGRTIFPVVDHNGQVVGAIGRSLKLSPKYKAVGKGFVGNILTEEQYVILTEGVIDALLAEQMDEDIAFGAGRSRKDNVVGVVGDVSDEAIASFAEKQKKIILFFDQDELGTVSAEKLAKRMREVGVDVYIYQDDAKDYPEYLANGGTITGLISAKMLG